MPSNLYAPVKIKLLNPQATIPAHGSAEAAGWDVCACQSCLIQPKTVAKISTGIAVETPKNCFMGIFARSGKATKQGLRPANCVGIVDSDYRGEVIVPLYNDSDKTQKVEKGEKIAQLIILPYVTWDIQIVNELDDTARGEGGFGSTGK